MSYSKFDEHVNGTKYWFYQGKLHREDGPAVECFNGDKEWCFQGNWHRVDGPALEYANGDKTWYIHGKLHRFDGPAVEWINRNRWFFRGKNYTKKEYIKIISNLTILKVVVCTLKIDEIFHLSRRLKFVKYFYASSHSMKD
jgi:hypothetical protein